jgi:hypothetical protein
LDLTNRLPSIKRRFAFPPLTLALSPLRGEGTARHLSMKLSMSHE